MIVNQRSLYYLRVLIDLIILNSAYFIAALTAQSFELLILKSQMFVLQMGLNVLWLFSSNLIRFYDDSNSRYFAFQFINILKNISVQAFAAILFIFITKEDLFTRNFILYYSFFLAFLITLRHVVFRKTLKALRRQGKNIRNLLIIGSGEISLNFYNILKDHPDFGYKFTGFINDKNEISTGKDMLGNIADLEKVISQHKIEEAVIALSEYNPVLLDEIIRLCNKNAVKVHIIPDYFRYMSKKFQISMLGDFPIITVRNEPLDEVQWRFVKRAFDIIFSFIVIVLILSWLVPLITILIRAQSSGAAIFKQERIGVKNKRFVCYKFRTMYSKNNGEDSFQPASSTDPRITPVGHFLRKTSIDELPQFINVFKGDMSVVGPRPHTVPFDIKYGQIVEAIKMRYNVKPGITGWAQIHGLRGDAPDEQENTIRIKKRIEFDLWYIENWSVWLDIQIILLTVWHIVRGKTEGM
ncbi:MAG: undecaprenyl-phosphate glucose phosphotransferase [Ignavibacteriaceae bacterium]